MYDTFALQNFVSTYLGHTSVSPLQEAFVNGNDALATSAAMSVYTLSHPYVQVRGQLITSTAEEATQYYTRDGDMIRT